MFVFSQQLQQQKKHHKVHNLRTEIINSCKLLIHAGSLQSQLFKLNCLSSLCKAS